MGSSTFDDDQSTFEVVWPADREIPAGWHKAGKHGTKAECLEHINTVWTDMRPLSLRKKMAQS
jgi:MbtH protein